MNFKTKKLLSTGFGVLVMAIGVSSCGEPQDDGSQSANTESSVGKEPSGGYKGRGEYLPFRLAFKSDGTPVILDEKGKPEHWERAELPLKTKVLFDLKAFSVAFVQGSCTVLFSDGNGGLIQRTYPSTYCKMKGIPEN